MSYSIFKLKSLFIYLNLMWISGLISASDSSFNKLLWLKLATQVIFHYLPYTNNSANVMKKSC